MTFERSCFRQVHPGGVFTRGLEHCGDELYSGDAVIDGGYEQRLLRGRALRFVRGYLFGDVGVNLREGFEITLGMAGGNAAGVLGGFRGRWSTARDDLRWLAVCAEAQRVRFFLAPLDSGFFAVDAQAQIVFVTNCDLAGPEQAAR